MKTGKARKPQERAASTRTLLLTAAEHIFAQHGYEKAQLAEIAQSAGFSKGALYAHFKSKEDLFLALARTKAARYEAKLRVALEGAADRDSKVAAFRKFYVDLPNDRAWALIILEAKLLLSRNPEVKQRLRRAEEELENSVERELVALFGRAARPTGKALGGICSALVLEAGLEPSVLTNRKMKAALGRIFDSLLEL